MSQEAKTIPDYDYEALGLMVGLEIHQQVDSPTKLHCRCPNIYREPEESTHEIRRYLRPKANNLGMMDRAVVEQTQANRQSRYMVFDTTCLGDVDEAGPAPVSPEALKTTLEVSKLLHMVPADRAHVMRKIIVDGSGPGGFQRTTFIAGNGWIETKSGKCRVASLCLEEESAPKMEETDEYVVFSLDRLGVPLIEVATEPDIRTPEQTYEVASYLGMALRSTLGVKRGIGTIRQDVNVSIRNGTRVEMKGVQALSMIGEIVKREIFRQLALIEIKDELNSKGASVDTELYDVTSIFAETKSKVIINSAKKRKILAICLKGFDGYVGREVQPGRRLGTELSEKAKAVGVSGLFHTDELPNYGITAEEVAALRKAVNAEADDAVIMISGREEVVKRAMESVLQRAEQVLIEIPQETRHALPDGNTSYMRPLPGAARMYPETDLPTFAISRQEYRDLPAPELLIDKAKRYMKEYGINKEFADMIAFSKYMLLFEKLAEKYKESEAVTSTLLARTFTGIMPELKREGLNIDSITDTKFEEMFDKVAEGALPKDATRNVLVIVCNDSSCCIAEAVEKLGIGTVDQKEIEDYIDSIVAEKKDFIAEKGPAAVGPLMGIVMEKYRGKIEGKTVSAMLKERIDKMTK
ncbi:Glutamyl-tRNA(Gln) amidotransferase subunit B, chloroplastic/mitochondrial [Methanimicrococcus sp. At1]|uniref:Glutamyl-tRNA(Gln) amidotransferase subunit E n=1 Tax=Methanimicrococcus hacksteinii TaxID=3028293 RepID=A0ABU3VNH8_9EURY|nr:Glu-tRNA(Gln) amidotransferase subunit GatE [Methanimicrococcus sp. At1]MDV0444963.1 Glutamyl-tRNA(Gln) amidotransferase subunit B, chloroplastic/mitochondrial [Methanimicrococcus sp. At1]